MKKKPSACLTSELLYQALKGDLVEQRYYLAEYKKRLEKLGLSEKIIRKFRNLDEKAILLGSYIKPDTLLISKPFIKPSMTKKSINVNNCTMSELVYLIEDTNKAFMNFDYWENTPAKELILQHTLNYYIRESTYVIRYRLQSIGLSIQQINAFIENECIIIHNTNTTNSKSVIKHCEKKHISN